MTTAIYAVVLAITALGGNKTMKEMLLSQPTVLRPVGLLPGQGDSGAPLP